MHECLWHEILGSNPSRDATCNSCRETCGKQVLTAVAGSDVWAHEFSLRMFMTLLILHPSLSIHVFVLSSVFDIKRVTKPSVPAFSFSIRKLQQVCLASLFRLWPLWGLPSFAPQALWHTRPRLWRLRRAAQSRKARTFSKVGGFTSEIAISTWEDDETPRLILSRA